MEILLLIGTFFTILVIFVGLPILIFNSLREFAMISKFGSPILKYSIVIAVLLAYLLIMTIFFFFNVKILN